MTKRGTITLLLVAFLMTMVVAGCSKPGVTKSNYDKVENDMTLAQVEKLLGPAKEGASVGGAIGELAGQGAAHIWEDGDKKITVFIKDDKVVKKLAVGL